MMDASALRLGGSAGRRITTVPSASGVGSTGFPMTWQTIHYILWVTCSFSILHKKKNSPEG
jgi:hypothetical protein